MYRTRGAKINVISDEITSSNRVFTFQCAVVQTLKIVCHWLV